MTIFELLNLVHNEIEAGFERVSRAGARDVTREAFRSLATKLIACMHTKHAVVYPRFGFLAGLDEEVATVMRGHARIEQLLNELRLEPLDDAGWRTGCAELHKLVRSSVVECGLHSQWKDRVPARWRAGGRNLRSLRRPIPRDWLSRADVLGPSWF